jgi:hypothetical protein
VPNQIWPVLPLLLEPVLKISTPEVPLTPALAVRMMAMPLVVAVPSPAVTLKTPPVFTKLRPAAT